MTNIERGISTQEEHLIDGQIEAFEAQQDDMKNIYEFGFAKHVENLPDLSNAFDLDLHQPFEGFNRCACCMDGRTPYGIHAAGSGILLPKDKLKKFIQDSGITSISSHDGCGAAKIYAEKMGLNVADSDRVGSEWAEKTAKEFGLEYIHLEVIEPHTERVCYYDGTGKFNYKGVEGLPTGFVVGRANMDKKSSLAECSVAGNIAFGSHGFGEELLNAENPFIFVAIGETQEKMEILKKELEEFAKNMGPGVKVDGFVAPKNKE